MIRLRAGSRSSASASSRRRRAHPRASPDDCAELTAFRAFRDGWLRQRPDGPERIAEYYAVAPSIVAGVEYCDDAPARYAEIRSRWLGPCYAALQRGEMERCYDTYQDMVQTLQERYGVQ